MSALCSWIQKIQGQKVSLSKLSAQIIDFRKIAQQQLLLLALALLRYRNQEFLLTDSVFRYDGYSQLDDD